MELLPRTHRASLVLRRAGLALDDDDPRVRLVSSFLTRVPTWRSALKAGVSEHTALWAVQWLVAHCVPEETSSWEMGYKSKVSTPMDQAAKHGYLTVVRFLHEHSTLGCSKYAMEHAAQNGHLRVVQFLHEHQCSADGARFSIYLAVTNGDLAIVQYLHETAQQPMGMRMWERAAERGHLHVLAYIHARLPPGAIAAASADLLVGVMSAAIRDEHIDIVTWLYEMLPEARECSQEAFHDAIQSKNHQVVRFVLEQHFKSLDFVEAMDYAAWCGDVEMLQVFHDYSPAGCSARALDNAALRGHYDAVCFLSEHRAEGCTAAAMHQAASNGHLEVVTFLQKNRTEGVPMTALANASSKGHVEIVRNLRGVCRRDSNAVTTTRRLKLLAYVHAKLDCLFFWRSSG